MGGDHTGDEQEDREEGVAVCTGEEEDGEGWDWWVRWC